MTPNVLVILASAFIPFIVAFVWFHKSVFGGEKWHAMADMSTEKAASPVKPIQLLLSIVLNAFLAFGMYLFSIHEPHTWLGAWTGSDAFLCPAFNRLCSDI